MSDDYAKGFKDGFAAGLEEGKKLNDKSYTDGYIEGLKKTMPAPYNPNPSWPSYWSTYVTCDGSGAIGSPGVGGAGYSSQNMGVGANGPAGPYDGPQYANKVWVNGTWADLGG